MVYFKSIKVLAHFFACLITVFCLGPPVLAGVILEDDFSDLSLTDSNRTTASLKADSGWFQLPTRGQTAPVVLRTDGSGYAAATREGIRFFEFDGSEMVENPFLAIPGETAAEALAFDWSGKGLWVLNRDALHRYDFDGTGMKFNPALSLEGLSGACSLGVCASFEGVVLLSESVLGTAEITSYGLTESGSLSRIPGLSFNTGMPNPAALAVVPESGDLVVAADGGIRYFVFDQAAQAYELNPELCQDGNQVVAAVSSGRSGSYALLCSDGVEFYQYAPGSGLQFSAGCSATLAADGMGLSVKPGAIEYVVLENSGRINWYVYGGEGEGMVVLTPRSCGGLAVTGGSFAPEAVYQSVARSAEGNVTALKLEVYENNDAHTSISFQVSLNAGVDWLDLVPGAWLSVPESLSFIVRALLVTAHPDNTPRLTGVRLEGTSLTLRNLLVSDMALPPPGQALPAGNFPALVTAGSECVIEVETDGFADSVTAVLTGGQVVPLNPLSAGPVDCNRWQGSFVVPPEAVQGSALRLDLTTESMMLGETEAIYCDPFLIVNGTVTRRLRLRLLYNRD